MKSLYFEYLNHLPMLPNDLEKFVFSSTEGRDLFHKKNGVYAIFDANVCLKNFLKEFFDLSVYNIRVQSINADTIIHVDHNRIEAINYIVSSGGNNVITSFYNDNLDLIEDILIEEKKWHRLRVDVKHSVRNITSPPRVAITVHIPIKR